MIGRDYRDQRKAWLLASVAGLCIAAAGAAPYTIVDTGQLRCYSDNTEIEYPDAADAFFGQDAQYAGNEPAYKDNGDGTVTELATFGKNAIEIRFSILYL